MKDRIRSYLEDKTEAKSIEDILEVLGLEDDKKEEVEAVLQEMESKDHEVFVCGNGHRYILIANNKNLRVGIVSQNPKSGDYYLKVGKNREDNLELPKKNLNSSLVGDWVIAERHYATDNDRVMDRHGKKDRRERKERQDQRENTFGRVVKIIERNINNIVGEIVKGDNGTLAFMSYDKRDIKFIIDESSLNECVEGEVVALELGEALSHNTYLATIKEKLGHKDDAGMDIKIICAKHEVYDEFPAEVMEQAEAIPNEVEEKDRIGRVDLTDKMIFTIDGKDTKDIDDAISLEMTPEGNYLLGVHIADVSYYVEEGTPLDVEALKRGTSCYPPGSVIPMLPHKLSNGICSLNEDVDRCAITFEMEITPQGKVKNPSIYPSIIHSRKKMNYDDVNSILERDEVPAGYEEFAETLKLMNECAHIIREAREARGSSDFDIKEPKVICDEYGKAVDIVCRDRGEGERLIEDFMLSANEISAAQLFYNRAYGVQLPGVYRVHEFPLEEKVNNYISFLAGLGFQIKGDVKKITYHTISDILKQIEEDPRIKENETLARVVKSMAVRSMPKAYYTPENLGHYGLALKKYSQSTSPIRRYPDLQQHRLLRTLLFERRVDGKTISYFENLLPQVCQQCSDRELKAAEAEREAVKMKMAEYMESYIGEEFEAFVTGVTATGMYVQLPNSVEGMIPLRTLDSFYTYDEASQTLSNKEGDRILLGTPMIVKCVGASKEAQTIDFEIVKRLDLEEEQGKTLKKHHGRG